MYLVSMVQNGKGRSKGAVVLVTGHHRPQGAENSTSATLDLVHLTF